MNSKNNTNKHKTMKKIKVVKTDRNEGLEPMPLGNIGVAGYVPEIHSEDALEFTYKLPLGAIKRLIKSYFEEIQDVDEESVYLHQSGSYGLRMWPYCYKMIDEICKQLNGHGLGGKKIIDEVFDTYFKKDYEKMKRFSKNHGDQDIMNDFKPCDDPECCEPKKKDVQK